jgi:Tetracyclin repressor-like, C-terminal domain
MVPRAGRVATEVSNDARCPFGTIGHEVTENDELIRQDLSLMFEVARTRLATLFIREKASGRLDAAADEHGLADFCLATIQGATLMGKVKRDARLVEQVVHEAMTHLGSVRWT